MTENSCPMQVSIEAYTPHPEKLIVNAARQCYSDMPTDTMVSSDRERLIKRLLKDGHLSPFEHASITYHVSGISRACSHQLVRHRLASYTQRSQRYVRLDQEPRWVIPPSLTNDHDCYHEYRHELWRAWDTYREMIKNDVPVEDARYVLPNATPTSIVVTMNFRELLHFFELRCCTRAQWEIRLLAREMLMLARLVAPVVFAKAGAPCGRCEEMCE